LQYKVSRFHPQILTLDQEKGKTKNHQEGEQRGGDGNCSVQEKERERVGRERDIYPPLTLD